jgi:hypothetical protein
MATTSTARIANDSPFCDAWAAMEKIIERLLTMASEGASIGQVTQLLASDGTAMLRELTQSYVEPQVGRPSRQARGACGPYLVKRTHQSRYANGAVPNPLRAEAEARARQVIETAPVERVVKEHTH